MTIGEGQNADGAVNQEFRLFALVPSSPQSVQWPHHCTNGLVNVTLPPPRPPSPPGDKRLRYSKVLNMSWSTFRLIGTSPSLWCWWSLQTLVASSAVEPQCKEALRCCFLYRGNCCPSTHRLPPPVLLPRQPSSFYQHQAAAVAAVWFVLFL